MFVRWDDDQVFQEARKIVGAMIQKITFDEWLPKVTLPKLPDCHTWNNTSFENSGYVQILGSRYDAVLGSYRGYDPSVNPAIANEFNAAAFRFGHGMIQEIYDRLDPQGRVMSESSLLCPLGERGG